jgi:hypothetical protein
LALNDNTAVGVGKTVLISGDTHAASHASAVHEASSDARGGTRVGILWTA